MRSRAVRSAKARARNGDLWDWMVNIAIMHEPRTLREYAVHLTNWGVATARGGAWSPGLVSHAMKAHGTTPKSLLNRVTKPSPFEKRPDWQVEVYRQLRDALNRLDDTTDENGDWLSATLHPVQRTDLVRHQWFGIGQAERQVAVARYRCSFLNEQGSFQVDCLASELEVFRYRLSREDRIAAGDRLRVGFLQRYPISKPFPDRSR